MIVKDAFVRCDNCGVEDSRHTADHGRVETRSIAKADGFIRHEVNGELWDLCPACADSAGWSDE